MDGYSTQTPTWGCPYIGCDFMSDDAEEMIAHEIAHEMMEVRG
jgi:hypothetical protein